MIIRLYNYRPLYIQKEKEITKMNMDKTYTWLEIRWNLYFFLKELVFSSCFRKMGMVSPNTEAEYLKVNLPKLVLFFGR